MMETKSFSRNLHGSKLRLCEYCSLGVLNLDTGAITPPFHVVFDNWFTTVTTSIDDLPDFNFSAWSKMFDEGKYHFIRDEDDTQVNSEDSMASETITTRQNQVSKAMDTTMPSTPIPVSPPPSSPSTPLLHASPVPSSPMSPSSSPSIGVSPPALPLREKSHFPATEGAIKDCSHPFTPAMSTEGTILTNSLMIPPDMQAKIYVEHGPLQEVLCLYFSPGFD